MKNCITLFFVMAAMFASLPIYSESVWDGTADVWTSGTGVESDPYKIENAQQLSFLAEMVNGGVSTYNGKYFVLTNDLNLNNLEWTPIGSATHKFAGVFDGAGHVIKNIKITVSQNYSGLFGYTTNTIKNLSVSGSIRNGGYSGGITGRNSGRIENCKSNCTVSSSTAIFSSSSEVTYAGGISGYGGGSIINCSNRGTVSASTTISSSHSSYVTTYAIYSYAGGISGYGESSIANCSNTGSVSSSSTSTNSYSIPPYVKAYAGGISGYGNGSITNCSNGGAVSSSSTTASFDTDVMSYAGGISSYGNSSSITNCSNGGSVSSKSSKSYSSNSSRVDSSYAGGILGSGNSSSITNCYNRGVINSSGIVSSFSCGIAKNAKVVNSYNVGLLKTGEYKYGVGDGTLTNSYYLETCGSESGRGTKKTASAMRSVSFPILLNGGDETVFVMDVNNINDGYPVFAWQNGNSIIVSCNSAQGSTSGSGSYVSGSSAIISATPNSGYIFAGWNDGDTTNPRTITVTGNAHYVALFEQAVINIKVGQDCTITQE